MGALASIASILFSVAPLASRLVGGGSGSGWVATTLQLLGKFLNCAATPAEIQVKLKELDTQKLIALAQIDAELQMQMMSCDMEIVTAQSEINAQEAASDDKFKSRWRPFIGWICGSSFALIVFWNLILMPILVACGVDISKYQTLASTGVDLILAFTPAMLGIGGMRTYEKFKGVS